MTGHDTIQPPNLRNLISIALPMIASQASETIMLFVDRLFLSFLGKEHIAASMSGGLSAFVFSALFAGIVGYTNALVAQYYGSGNRSRCVEATMQGVYLSGAFVPFLFAVIPLVRVLFVAAGHTPGQVDLEFRYFRILMAGSFLVLFRQALVGFFLGIGKTRVVMLANVVGMFVNVPMNYVLIFGAFGLPAYGIEGAAIGTVCGSATILAVLIVAFARHEFVRSRLPETSFRLQGTLMLRLVKFGLPAGMELFLNVLAFNVFVQLMHSMGPEVAAAVTITFNYDMVAFIPMIGLGIAVTAMVGRHMGAGRPDDAERATWLALKVGYTYAAIMMVIFVLGAGPLVRVFSAGFDEGDAATLQLARSMLRLAAVYTLADLTQLVFAGALRGAGDTRWVMTVSVVLHWVMAVSVILMIRVLVLEPLVIWFAFILFVLLLGITIFLRFRGRKWREIRVIEELVPPEALDPEIGNSSHWM